MRKRYYALRKIKIRQSWNKYNLYNLSRAQPQRTQDKTFFQQKWEAKAATRAYHGETVREKKWTRMFRRGIRSVVPLDHVKLAKYDGSEQAEGRGAGADVAEDEYRIPPLRTPFMQMVYAPLERRLDTAIFRSLFASSTRQARQMVVHGAVKVNGQKMIYPGYQLNPGDMFQVEPERVLFATGAPKDVLERRATRSWKKRVAKRKSEAEENNEQEPEKPLSSTTETTDQTPKQTLKDLLGQAKSLLSTPSTSLSARRKQDLRAFQRAVKRALSRRDDLATATLDTQLQEITSRMAPEERNDVTSEKMTAEGVPTMSDAALQAEAATLKPDQMRVLREAMAQARDNPVDISKPYATPWRPRQYMSAFAFIPRYLEVHPKICAAVYVRHPVARPGLGEVPTPFAAETNALAHNWYLRRR